MDKLYLLSRIELYGTESSWDTVTLNFTRRLDYYSLETSNYKKNYNGNNAGWWLRNTHGERYFDYANNPNSLIVLLPSAALGVSPAFRIG